MRRQHCFPYLLLRVSSLSLDLICCCCYGSCGGLLDSWIPGFLDRGSGYESDLDQDMDLDSDEKVNLAMNLDLGLRSSWVQRWSWCE